MGNPIAIKELINSAFEDFIIAEEVTAPYTTIQNRAKVTASLKAIAGIERVMVTSGEIITSEFGPSGEQVWGTTDSRIRFVGVWQNIASSDTHGSRMVSSTNGAFLEVTFYGTGLNWITLLTANAGSTSIVASVDGAAEGANILASYTSSSGILLSRNYGQNVPINVVSGLTLGWHTVKIRLASLVTTNFHVLGFEVVNERTNLAVLAGKGVAKGDLVGLSAMTTAPFKDGIVGTRGGRVIKYLESSVLKYAVTEVDTVSKFITNTDHTNEESLRRIYFKEFAANRADDFGAVSTSVAGSYVFTLDDGSTTLVASNIRRTSADTGIFPHDTTNGAWIQLTFVGTGLDIITWNSATLDINYNIFVDGVSVHTGTGTSIFGGTPGNVKRICSGLPYGSHTVRIQSTSTGTSAVVISDFIIYQPKKPALPFDSFEVADFNVLADYVQTSVLLTNPSQGVLKKVNTRELTFSGTWNAFSMDTSHSGGFITTTTTAGSYVEYTFYGTGIDHRTYLNGTFNRTYSIDGSTNLSAYTISLATSGAIGNTALNSATGVLSGTTGTSVNYGDIVSIRGLPLGLHKIRVTFNSGSSLIVDSFDIHSPIHINDSSFKIGSQSLKSASKFSPEKSQANAKPDLSKAKAWLYYDGVTGRIKASKNISGVATIGTGNWWAFFEKPFKTENYVAIISSSTQEAYTTAGMRIPNRVAIVTANSAGTPTNADFYLVCYGELVDE